MPSEGVPVFLEPSSVSHYVPSSESHLPPRHFNGDYRPAEAEHRRVASPFLEETDAGYRHQVLSRTYLGREARQFSGQQISATTFAPSHPVHFEGELPLNSRTYQVQRSGHPIAGPQRSLPPFRTYGSEDLYQGTQSYPRHSFLGQYARERQGAAQPEQGLALPVAFRGEAPLQGYSQTHLPHTYIERGGYYTQGPTRSVQAPYGHGQQDYVLPPAHGTYLDGSPSRDFHSRGVVGSALPHYADDLGRSQWKDQRGYSVNGREGGHSFNAQHRAYSPAEVDQLLAYRRELRGRPVDNWDYPQSRAASGSAYSQYSSAVDQDQFSEHSQKQFSQERARKWSMEQSQAVALQNEVVSQHEMEIIRTESPRLNEENFRERGGFLAESGNVHPQSPTHPPLRLPEELNAHPPVQQTRGIEELPSNPQVHRGQRELVPPGY